MKLLFKERCKDKNTGETYQPGEVHEFDDARGAEILSVRGGKYAERLPEPIEEENAADEASGAREDKRTLQELTAAELRNLAREAKIPGFSKMKKAELIKALSE